MHVSGSSGANGRRGLQDSRAQYSRGYCALRRWCGINARRLLVSCDGCTGLAVVFCFRRTRPDDDTMSPDYDAACLYRDYCQEWRHLFES